MSLYLPGAEIQVCCEMHPAFALYVYLCEISLPHDVGPYNNNCPKNIFPVNLFVCCDKVHVAHMSSYTVPADPGSRATDHRRKLGIKHETIHAHTPEEDGHIES